MSAWATLLPLAAALPLQSDVRILPPDRPVVVAREARAPADPPDVPQPPRALFTLPSHWLPPVPPGPPNQRPQPTTPPARDHSGDRQTVSAGTGEFTFFRNRVVRPAGANFSTISAVEPSAASCRDIAFETGNWYAGLSIDSGQTWTLVNPNMFPALDGGFCCDQRVEYVPSRNITVWLLQYAYSATTQNGSYRIAVANGRNGLRNAGTPATWATYVYNPQNFGFAAGNWLDFPDVACNDDWFYVSANVFSGNGNNYVGTVRWRINLDDLQAGAANPQATYATDATLGAGASLRFANGGSGARMHWADTVNSTTIRIWRQDGDGTNSSVDRAVGQWRTSQASCPGPDSLDWMGSAVGRIRGACGTSSELIFFWTSDRQPAANRPLPYTRVARFAAADRTLINEHDIWHEALCWGYATGEASSLDHVGVVIAVGGPGVFVHTSAFIVDQYEGWNRISSRVMGSGTNGPTGNRWGDYLDVQRHWFDPRTFIGTGFELNGGNAPANVRPRYAWFGRNDYEPTWVNLDVSSGPPTAVQITIDVTDRNNQKDGLTEFIRSFTPRQGYVLVAPTRHVEGTTTWYFDKWVLNGVPQPRNQPVLTVPDIGEDDDAAVARYLAVKNLAVVSFPPGHVEVSPADINGASSGTSPFNRLYPENTLVTLTAPAVVGLNPFKRWRQGTTLYPTGQVTVTVNVAADLTMTAEFYEHVAGGFTPFGVGCAGSNGPDLHAASGTPEIGETVSFGLANGRANSAALLVLGFSNTLWNGIPLPLPVPGAPGCSVYISVDATFATGTDTLGRAAVALRIPGDIALVGAHAYTEFGCLDLGANPRDLTFSNGLDTLVGGNR